MRNKPLLGALEELECSINETRQPDAIHVSVPLFIRLLEWSREEVKCDESLHFMTEKLVAACQDGLIADMDAYDAITDVKLTGKD